MKFRMIEAGPRLQYVPEDAGIDGLHRIRQNDRRSGKRGLTGC
jgi:hypothetical protein